MSDRLAELQRQRALLQAHLKWLDQEIADARKKSDQPAFLPASLPGDATPSPEADLLMSRYGSDPQNSVQNVKKGCYTAFALGLGLLGLAVYAFYLYKHWPKE